MLSEAFIACSEQDWSLARKLKIQIDGSLIIYIKKTIDAENQQEI